MENFLFLSLGPNLPPPAAQLALLLPLLALAQPAPSPFPAGPATQHLGPQRVFFPPPFLSRPSQVGPLGPPAFPPRPSCEASSRPTLTPGPRPLPPWNPSALPASPQARRLMWRSHATLPRRPYPRPRISRRVSRPSHQRHGHRDSLEP